MTETTKDQRKALKTIITNAISVALSKNTYLKDKKVQKAIKNAASEVAKKIEKASIVKVPKAPASKVSIPKTAKVAVKKVVKKVVKAVRKPVAKKVSK